MTIGELPKREDNPNAEIDDFLIAVEITKDITGLVPAFWTVALAKWVARLREHYVQIGRDIADAELVADRMNEH